MIERISEGDWHTQAGHIYRYELAADHIRPGETVLDIASGIGYGAQLMKAKTPLTYIGADKIEPSPMFASLGTFHSGINIDTWKPPFAWDVSVSFETLEHLINPARLAKLLKQAKRLIILSTPTRPTKHLNHYHLHDFTVQEVLDLFTDDTPEWEVLHLEDQPEELSHIFIFGKKGQS